MTTTITPTSTAATSTSTSSSSGSSTTTTPPPPPQHNNNNNNNNNNYNYNYKYKYNCNYNNNFNNSNNSNSIVPIIQVCGAFVMFQTEQMKDMVLNACAVGADQLWLTLLERRAVNAVVRYKPFTNSWTSRLVQPKNLRFKDWRLRVNQAAGNL